MHSHFRLFIVLAVVLPLSMAVAQDTVYKWVDEQGRTHYGDQQPDTVEDLEMIEVFDAPENGPSQTAALEEELKRIRELSEELQAAREDRERDRLERRLDALERAYSRQLAVQEEQREQDRENVILYPGFFHRFHPHFSHLPKKKFHHKPKIHEHHLPRHRDFDALAGPRKPDIADSFERSHTNLNRQVQPPSKTQVDPPRIRSMGIQQ